MRRFSLKVQNTVFGYFLTIFGNFCLLEDFLLKIPSVTQNHKWASNSMSSFRKKLMYQLREKPWTDGQVEGQTTRPTFKQCERSNQHQNKEFCKPKKRHELKPVTIYIIQLVSFLVRPNKNESMIQLF